MKGIEFKRALTRLRSNREALGISQQVLAEEVGLTQAGISQRTVAAQQSDHVGAHPVVAGEDDIQDDRRRLRLGDRFA